MPGTSSPATVSDQDLIALQTLMRRICVIAHVEMGLILSYEGSFGIEWLVGKMRSCENDNLLITIVQTCSGDDSAPVITLVHDGKPVVQYDDPKKVHALLRRYVEIANSQ